MENILEKMKTTRLLATIGVVALLIGVFFTYLSLDVYLYSSKLVLINYWEGKTIFALTLINLLYIFKDYVKKYVPKMYDNEIGRKVDEINNPKVLIVPTAIIAILAIYLVSEIDVSSEYIEYGLGFYALWVGIIALGAHSFLYKYENMPVVQPTQQPMNNNYNQPMQQPMNNNYNQPTQQPMNNNVQSMKICPTCSAQCDINTKFCPKCGRQF
ncbi:MAG: hypothetical protein R3Y21_03765 [Mycoplasmatota bacterium]